MKKIFLFAIALASILVACDSSKNNNTSTFTINAEITGVEESTPIYLQKFKDGKLESVDSAKLSASKVSFTGSLESPEMIYLQVGKTRKMVNLFGENSTIFVKVNIDSLDKAEVNGSKSHDDLMAFRKYLEPVNEKAIELNKAYDLASKNFETEKMEMLGQDYQNLRIEHFTLIEEFVASKPDSYFTPYVIREYLADKMHYLELDSMLVKLDSSIHDSKDYQILSQRVKTNKSIEVGMPAVDFALNDTTGNPISISSFQGKILLIDFWASWCGPCRHENPRVVKLYNDFREKGFEIIGVSFDEKRSAWIDAIHQDQLAWPHVSDLKGWSSAAGKLYAVTSIPATILLDRDGIIVAKNLRGDALRKKLEEIYAAEKQNI